MLGMPGVEARGARLRQSLPVLGQHRQGADPDEAELLREPAGRFGPERTVAREAVGIDMIRRQ
ncbi:hypothetical protein BTHI11S_04139 [Bosea thiooxidans]